MGVDIDFASSPLVIGGVGGSGTRVLAKLAQEMNVHIGEYLNKALDNLWFSLFFNQLKWAYTSPEQEILQSLKLFAYASLDGFQSNASVSDMELIKSSLSTSRLARRAPELGDETMANILQSKGILKSEYKMWGWKEPNSHMFIAQIASYFPNVRYILMVRNGLDMAFSNNQHQVRLWGQRFGIELDNTTSVPPAQSLQYWLNANALARQNLQQFMPKRWLEVHYENLLLNPVFEINRIAKFIDIDIKTETSHILSQLVKTPPSVGRFKAHDLGVFRPDQIETVKALGFSVT